MQNNKSQCYFQRYVHYLQYIFIWFVTIKLFQVWQLLMFDFISFFILRDVFVLLCLVDLKWHIYTYAVWKHEKQREQAKKREKRGRKKITAEPKYRNTLQRCIQDKTENPKINRKNMNEKLDFTITWIKTPKM